MNDPEDRDRALQYDVAHQLGYPNPRGMREQFTADEWDELVAYLRNGRQAG